MLRYGLRYGLGYGLEYELGYGLKSGLRGRGVKSRTPDPAVLYRWRNSVAMRSRNAKCMPLIVSEILIF